VIIIVIITLFFVLRSKKKGREPEISITEQILPKKGVITPWQNVKSAISIQDETIYYQPVESIPEQKSSEQAQNIQKTLQQTTEKPILTSSTKQDVCLICGKTTYFNPEMDKFYCYNCQKYE
jgi:hypothetical protein